MGTHKRKKILYIYNDEFLAGLYEFKFKKYGFDFVGLQSPIKNPVEHIQHERPDIIITELTLREADGFDLVRKIKHDPETKNILVAAFTNLGQPEDIIRAAKAGVDEYWITSNHTPHEIVQKSAALCGISIPDLPRTPSTEVKNVPAKQKIAWG